MKTDDEFITNPIHGGKETCKRCGKPVLNNGEFIDAIDMDTNTRVWFCKSHRLDRFKDNDIR